MKWKEKRENHTIIGGLLFLVLFSGGSLTSFDTSSAMVKGTFGSENFLAISYHDAVPFSSCLCGPVCLNYLPHCQSQVSHLIPHWMVCSCQWTPWKPLFALLASKHWSQPPPLAAWIPHQELLEQPLIWWHPALWERLSYASLQKGKSKLPLVRCHLICQDPS